SGGKLTTFRLIALDALLAAGLIDADDHGANQTPKERMFRFAVNPPHRLGHPLAALPTGDALLEQVRWVLEHEMVVHLDDLLLRRTRIGNLLPEGGKAVLAAIKPLCQQWLGWDEAEWEAEITRYLQIVERYYSVPQAGNSVANAA
ncbi:MAG: glycerol-3-phosphate dehydrogenase C-terminal domain-containing protein, partial [Alcanivoracaceae bacterium]|nr:glycerol-3-phosphate dehydrogenase C-terminal domain-containing protein [Alcanivoracaceae bacterium]